ncbi:MAG: hypothetical protein Q8S09_04460 [Hyphomonas sp.]|nr:hypothetical protein [Hyphomonas sp.]
MPVGFQSFTDGGVLQIDANFKHLVFHSKGTLSSFPTTITSGVSKRGEFSVAGLIAPVLLVKEDNGILRRVTKSGSTYTFDIAVKWAASAAEWYLFDVIPDAPASGGGFQLFTEAGELSFDASMRPLIPLAVSSVGAAGATYGVTSGRVYAVSFSAFPLFGLFDSMFSDEVARYQIHTFFPTRASATLLDLQQWAFRGAALGFGEYPPNSDGAIPRATTPVLVSIVDVTGL